jgi:ribosomal protein S18 acetylase RimI-like enzyme
MLKIRELQLTEEYPLHLFLLADPDLGMVESYAYRSSCFVLEENHEIVGSYLLLPTRPKTIELVNIAVLTKKQGRGYGKELVKHAMETARTLGYHTIEIGTGNSGIMQLGLYQKCGFRIVDVDLDFFTRHYKEPIFENGIQCRDMIRLRLDL